MTWANEIFQHRHGEVGVAAASALVSGLGNLGSVLTTYALYEGWPSDSRPGRRKYRKSNLVMVGILGGSILSSVVLTILLRMFDHRAGGRKTLSNRSSTTTMADGMLQDAAARREQRERGLSRIWWRRRP